MENDPSESVTDPVSLALRVKLGKPTPAASDPGLSKASPTQPMDRSRYRDAGYLLRDQDSIRRVRERIRPTISISKGVARPLGVMARIPGTSE